MDTMDTYDEGKKGGLWTVEDLKKHGWVERAAKEMPEETIRDAIIRRAAQNCLAYAEEAHIVDLAKIAQSGSAYAVQQREFLKALIESARESLGKIIGPSDEKPEVRTDDGKIYESGKKDGLWTVESLDEYGWVKAAAKETPGWKDGLIHLDDPAVQAAIIRKAAQDCLANEEQGYLDDMAAIEGKSTEAADRHREYMRGLIESARDSLGKIIASSADEASQGGGRS